MSTKPLSLCRHYLIQPLRPISARAIISVQALPYTASPSNICPSHFLCAGTNLYSLSVQYQANNAGMGSEGSIEQTTLAEYDMSMNTNVRSVYHLTMLAVPHLIASKGATVNVSSATALRAVSSLLHYAVFTLQSSVCT